MACEEEDAEVSRQATLVDEAEIAMEEAITIFNFRVQQLQIAVMAAVACHENQLMGSGFKEPDHLKDCAKTAVQQAAELVEQMKYCSVSMKQLRDAMGRT